MKKETKDTIEFIVSIFLLAAGVALSAWGMNTDPEGEIHGSVLTWFGEILTFVGAIWGIGKAAQVKIAEIAATTANKKEE